MDKDRNKKYDSVYSNKVRAGKRRTYFFDVRKTKGEDFYLTITESTKRYEKDGYERHKVFLYKEDFNRFLDTLQETIDHIKENLMPDYDYDEFTRRHEEWEAQKALENELQDKEISRPVRKIEKASPPSFDSVSLDVDTNAEDDQSMSLDSEPLSMDSEDDMKW
ncbi:MAG: DUF3276 family protein [Bacteroidota bacterium]